MSKAYVPGDDVDAIIARQVAKGNFPSADASDLVRLRAKIDAADTAYRRGEYRKSPGPDAMKADILARGEERSRRKT